MTRSLESRAGRHARNGSQAARRLAPGLYLALVLFFSFGHCCAFEPLGAAAPGRSPSRLACPAANAPAGQHACPACQWEGASAATLLVFVVAPAAALGIPLPAAVVPAARCRPAPAARSRAPPRA